MTGDLSMAEVLRLALDGRIAQLNTAMPARVESYDHTTQTARVKPLLKRAVPTPEEGYTLEELPEVHRVKVIHPGGEDWALHLPLKTGDTVQLVINQWDLSEWSRTGNASAPADRRTHSLANAVAFPGLRADAKAITGTSATNATLKHAGGFAVTFTPTGIQIGGASDALALASKVDAEINKIWAFLTTSAVTPIDGGTAFKVSATTALSATPVAPTASTTAKASG